MPPTDVTDGRTARRHRNRTAVLDAVIELFAESNLTPGVHDVADRSGVSLRSVYRYFDDVNDLVGAAIDRHIERAAHLFEIPDLGVGPLDERIDRFCGRRVNLFVSVRSVYRAALIRAADQVRVADGIEASRTRLREQCLAMFAPELDAMDDDRRDVTGVALDTMAQLDSVEYLHRTHAGDAARTTQLLAASYRLLLA